MDTEQPHLELDRGTPDLVTGGPGAIKSIRPVENGFGATIDQAWPAPETAEP